MSGSNVTEFNDAVLSFANELAPEAALRLHRHMHLEATKEIVERTPVDTGRLRGNWQATIGAPATAELARKDRSVATALARANSTLRALHPFGISYISNTLPYAEVVENGGYVPKDPEDNEEANKRRAWGRSKAKRRAVAAKFGSEGAPLVSGGFAKQAPQGMVAVTLARLSRMEPIQ